MSPIGAGDPVFRIADAPTPDIEGAAAAESVTIAELADLEYECQLEHSCNKSR